MYRDPNRSQGSQKETPSYRQKNGRWQVSGYQHFDLWREGDGTLRVHPKDARLRSKTSVVRPVLESLRQSGCVSMLDLGCSNGFFVFLARAMGYQFATGLDHDTDCIRVIMQLAHEFGVTGVYTNDSSLSRLEAEPRNVVLALSLVHWVYSCTEGYGDLNAVIAQLRKFTGRALVVEFVHPSDTAIKGFKHTTRFGEQRAPYSKDAFLDALGKHFSKVTHCGRTKKTRDLYLAEGAVKK